MSLLKNFLRQHRLVFFNSMGKCDTRISDIEQTKTIEPSIRGKNRGTP